MKNNFNTTEELLEKGKNINLSVSERDEMKSTLLSYARYHGVKEKSPKKSVFVWSAMWVRSVASASLALVLFVGTGYASANSLPGEFLYPVKTNVVEELTAATKLTPLSKLEYQHERYETRLYELLTLSEQGRLSELTLRESQTEILELSEEVEELMSGENGIEAAISLELVGDMVAMGNATEAIVRGSSTEEQLDAFESVTDNLEEVHEEEIVDLLETSTSTIEAYVEDQLSEISEELAENDIEENITIRVADYVEDAEISLEVEDYEDVVNSVSDAIILLQAEKYQDDFEDEVTE